MTVGQDLSSLGEDDLSRLVQVIETLENSAFDFLELEVGGMKVALGKGDPAGYAGSLRSGPPAQAAPAPAPAAAAPSLPAPAPAPAEATPAAAAAEAPAGGGADGAQETDVEVRAPMMGMFYTHPKPGEPPYVSVGDTVAPETTVALLEVMKMFNAVPAGVAGTVVAVLAEDNHLVEYGQPLFRVRPA